MNEFWLISAPGEQTRKQTFDKLSRAIGKERLSEIFEFNLPDFRIGSIDQLVYLLDEFERLDQFTEQLCRKLAVMRKDLEAEEGHAGGGRRTNDSDLISYLTRFSWNVAKYPRQDTLCELARMVNKEVTGVDSEIKKRSSAYHASKSKVQSVEKKQTGSLLTRDLGDLVKKEHFVHGSQYLVTLLVVVTAANYDDWLTGYHKWCDMVVPGSSERVFEDGDHGLFTVTLFRKVVSDFKTAARSKKCIVREFEYDEQVIQSGRNERDQMATDQKYHHRFFLRWVHINFRESFTTWVHIKAMRLFVESTLRYGLPVNFQGMLLLPRKESVKRLRYLLGQLYRHLGNEVAYGPIEEIPGLTTGLSEYRPYVDFRIKIDFLENKQKIET